MVRYDFTYQRLALRSALLDRPDSPTMEKNGREWKRGVVMLTLEQFKAARATLQGVIRTTSLIHLSLIHI